MPYQVGRALGIVAIILSIIGVFIWSIPLGIFAMIISAIGLISSEKGLNWIGLALGAITVIIGIL